MQVPRAGLGARGEAIAATFLEQRGWTVLDRNFRLGHKEIDLVVRRGEVVAFVEVKTRTDLSFGHPLDAITPRKQREIETVADSWIQHFGVASDAYRFDAVAILIPPGSGPVIEHLEGAWGI